MSAADVSVPAPTEVRLRFAPSPTGMFHVGSGRTALYNWLFVRHHGGTFILRVEDTDEARNDDQWTELIYESMRWLGLDWDEGPYLQSANKPKHAAAVQRLFDEGNAYYCDCTTEALAARKEAAGIKTPGYDNFCRDRGLGPESGGALRFRVPEGSTTVIDLIRGEPVFDHKNIEDFIVMRSNGVPMYNLANVVDDMNDRITHVVRAEEHLNNTPKQMLLWQALGGGTPPIYAHLPLIVNEKRQKISKRRDKVSLQMFRDEGFLPEAMRNYLVLLGWAPKGDREIVTVEQMVDEFRLEDVNKAGAFFDLVKLTHINGEYIRALSVEDFIERAQPFIERAGNELWKAEDFDAGVFATMAPLVQERVARLDEIGPMVDFLFVDEPAFDEAAMKVMEKPESVAMVDGALDRYQHVEWTHDSLHQATLELGEANGLKLGKAQAPIRLAVTGKKVGPPLFESLEVLGRDVVLERLRRLRATVAS